MRSLHNRRKKFAKTTDSNHKLPCAPNLLELDINIRKLDEVWFSNVTLTYTTQGRLYI